MLKHQWDDTEPIEPINELEQAVIAAARKIYKRHCQYHAPPYPKCACIICTTVAALDRAEAGNG